MGRMNDIMNAEVATGDFLPYTSLVTSSVVKMREMGAYVFSFELGGVAHTCASGADVNAWHDELSRLTAQIADPRLALHSTVISDPIDVYPAGTFRNHFARQYDAKYRALMASRGMHEVRLFLSLVFHPETKAERRLSRLAKPSREVLERQQREDLAAIGDLTNIVLAGLGSFRPHLLQCYEHDGEVFSETLELYSRILNGKWRRVLAPRADIRDKLATVRPSFGKGGLMSLKGATGIEYGAILAIDEYPEKTFAGCLQKMLGEPYPWVLSQTFTYVPRVEALDRMNRHLDQMEAAGDQAESQMKNIRKKLSAVAGGEVAMGEHELSLYVSAPDPETLEKRVADAGEVLSSAHITWLREDAGLGSAFYGMLPGNLAYRVSPELIDNTNFAAFISPHKHPAGRLDGTQWGPALTLFESDAHTPVAFSWHQPDPDPNAKFDPNHKEPATALVIGPTGKGKTVVLGHLLTETQKYATFPDGFPGVPKLSCVVFDKDYGMSIAVRALEGIYYPIKKGVPSGLSPFQMEPTPANLDFLDRFTCHLATPPGMGMTLEMRKKITFAVHSVMTHIPRPLRRIGALLQFFPEYEEDGLHARLAPWCAGGKNGWLFDNAEDTLDIDHPAVGFDVTDFLGDQEICTRLAMYLLHRVDSLVDGRRIPMFYDEAPTILSDPMFGGYIDRATVQIRKKDGFLVLAAQNARQFLDSPLAAILTSQPATTIWLPDRNANERDLIDGFHLTKAEVDLIKTMDKRQLLIRQGGTSTVVEFNLTGFEDELAVLSGNINTSALCNRLIDELGPNPDVWLPEFHRRRKVA